MKYSQSGEKPEKSSSLDLSKITNLIVIALVIYLGFILIKSILTNYAVNQEIDGLKREISQIERENRKLEEEIAYYDSEVFREIEARAKLGYQKPGEKVIVLPKTKEEIAKEREVELPSETQKEVELPNYLQWWRLFFSKR